LPNGTGFRGELLGPQLTDGLTNDHKTPFDIDELPEGSLYLADIGFFAIQRLCNIARCKDKQNGKRGKRYFVSRLQPHTNLYNRRGHLINLKGILPKLVGQVCEVGAVLGQKNGVPVRLITLRVPGSAWQKNGHSRIRETAQDHGRVPTEELLELAHWTIVITNVSRKRASYEEILVLLT